MRAMLPTVLLYRPAVLQTTCAISSRAFVVASAKIWNAIRALPDEIPFQHYLLRRCGIVY